MYVRLETEFADLHYSDVEPVCRWNCLGISKENTEACKNVVTLGKTRRTRTRVETHKWINGPPTSVSRETGRKIRRRVLTPTWIVDEGNSSKWDLCSLYQRCEKNGPRAKGQIFPAFSEYDNRNNIDFSLRFILSTCQQSNEADLTNGYLRNKM
jgi:hypothetical protein